MKTLTLLLALGLYLPQSYAQALKNDPSFGQTVAQSIRYPALARQQQQVAQAYVHFAVDTQGKIINVAILNAKDLAQPFQQEIKRVWQQLPAQEQQYKGDYILPISFVLDTKDQIKRATSELASLGTQSNHSTLLKEIVVTGYL